MKELITVGLSVYNAEDYIEDCIQSILNQSYREFKLIIVNDGSKDKSMDIVNRFKDDRITVYDDNENKGLAKRLNQIAKLAETDYLARMDTDDIMHPNRLEIQLEILRKHGNIDVLGTNVYSIDKNNNINGIRLTYMEEDESVIDFNFDFFVHPSIMAKTKWFLDNPYDEKIGRSQDYELWGRVKQKSNLKIYTKPLLFYREFGGSYYKKHYKGIKSSFYIANKRKSFRQYLVAIKKIFKTAVYFSFFLFKKEDYLISNRFHPIDLEQKNVARNILKYSIVKNIL